MTTNAMVVVFDNDEQRETYNRLVFLAAVVCVREGERHLRVVKYRWEPGLEKLILSPMSLRSHIAADTAKSGQTAGLFWNFVDSDYLRVLGLPMIGQELDRLATEAVAAVDAIRAQFSARKPPTLSELETKLRQWERLGESESTAVADHCRSVIDSSIEYEHDSEAETVRRVIGSLEILASSAENLKKELLR